MHTPFIIVWWDGDEGMNEWLRFHTSLRQYNDAATKVQHYDKIISHSVSVIPP